MSWVAVGTAAVGVGTSIYQSQQASSQASSQATRDAQAAQAAQAAAQAAEAARQAEIRKQSQIAQSQANAQKILTEAQIKSSRAKTTRTVTILSMIGGALLIATVSIVLVLKNKNKK